jgi:hypothetical protein
MAMATLTAFSGALNQRFAVKMMRKWKLVGASALMDASGWRSVAQENPCHQRSDAAAGAAAE